MPRIAELKHEARKAPKKQKNWRGSAIQLLLDRFMTLVLITAQLLHREDWKDKFNTLS